MGGGEAVRPARMVNLLSSFDPSSRRCNLPGGLTQPGFEAGFAESCVIARNQCSLAEFRSRVTRVGISNDFAEIFERGQAPPDELIQAKLFGASNFDNAVYRRAYRDSGHATGDIVGSHGLKKHMGQMHLVANHGNIGKPLEELEELRRVHDGVGEGRFFDQFFLSDLGTEVTALRQPLGSHDGQSNVMSYACSRFIGKEVTG